jgi:hypothetical protein
MLFFLGGLSFLKSLSPTQPLGPEPGQPRGFLAGLRRAGMLRRSGPTGACLPASPFCPCRLSRSGASGPLRCRCFVPWPTTRCRPGALASFGTPSSLGRSGSSASPCAAVTHLWAGPVCTTILGCLAGPRLRGLSYPSAEVVQDCPRLPACRSP